MIGDIFNNIAGVSSIVGLGIAGFTLWKVGSLKKNIEENQKKILFYNSVPKDLESLKEINTNLLESIAKYEEEKIADFLDIIDAHMQVITKKMPCELDEVKINVKKYMFEFNKNHHIYKENNIDFNASKKCLSEIHRNVRNIIFILDQEIEKKNFIL